MLLVTGVGMNVVTGAGRRAFADGQRGRGRRRRGRRWREEDKEDGFTKEGDDGLIGFETCIC